MTSYTKIIALLNNLEDAFYDIDSAIIQHPDLCKFAKYLEDTKNNVITYCKTQMQISQNELSNNFIAENIIHNIHDKEPDFINIQQLQTLSMNLE